MYSMCLVSLVSGCASCLWETCNVLLRFTVLVENQPFVHIQVVGLQQYDRVNSQLAEVQSELERLAIQTTERDQKAKEETEGAWCIFSQSS